MSGKLVIIRGPCGAGKSTVAHLVVEQLHGKVAHLKIDRFLALPQGRLMVLDPEKLYLAHIAAGRAAGAFVDAGYTVVADGALVILELPVFLAAAGVPSEDAQVFTLLPSLEVTLHRNRGRGPDENRQDDRIRRLHEWVDEELGVSGLRIDSSDQTPEQTASIILGELALGALGPWL